MAVAIPSTGCAHVEVPRALTQYRSTVAGAAALTDAGALELESTHRPGVTGVVDLSEPPTVVDEALHAIEHRFVPAAMTTATEVSKWVDDGFDGPTSQVDLRNGCSLSLGFAFVPSDDPGDATQPRRVLERHTIQSQLIPAGHWLHLWDGERWLGAAVVATADGGVMEISPGCDTLTIGFELPDRGPTSFAIHWQLDADEVAAPRSLSAQPLELAVEQRDAPETWGLDPVTDAGDRIELRLANLCSEPVAYAFTSTIDETPATTSTIPGHHERSVEVPDGWWLRYQTLADVWRGGATTSLGGGVVWLSSNCIDFGIGDGDVITFDG